MEMINYNERCMVVEEEPSKKYFHVPKCESGDYEEDKIVCYSFWMFESLSNATERKLLSRAKGCWSDKDQSLCKTQLIKNDMILCCCEGEYCNRDLSVESCLKEISNEILKDKDVNPSIISTDTIKLISLAVLIVAIPILAYYLIRLIKKTRQQQNRERDDEESGRRSNWNKELEQLLTDHDRIEIIEFRARGRYGDIYKARFVNDENEVDREHQIIAIKAFQQVDYKSFKNEFKIYQQLSACKHENILTFLKAEVRTGNLIVNMPEYWLITEYRENGSLQEYLGKNLLDEKQMVEFCSDIANGLAFLHGYGNSNRQIAHRDFKSGNILLDGQLRACISDFGLALIFYNHKLKSDTLNQVGAPRYFSPELLDGAINFSGDSLLKVDIYACALVFWEILSRCANLQDENQVKEYKLPFETELGTMPSINELRNHISFKQMRPVIEEHWRSTEFLSEFCRLIEDCWVHDSESRLTAAGISERLKTLKKLF